MELLDRLRAYSAKLAIFAFVGTLGAIAFAPFSPGGPLSMPHYYLTYAFAAIASVGFALYLGSKLLEYRRERRRRIEADARSISDVSRKQR